MKNKRSFVLILALTFLFSSASHAKNFPWPELKTDKQKVSFLLWLRNHTPEIFRDGISFKSSWFKLLDKQDELLHRLKRFKLYRELDGKRQELIQITDFEAAKVNGIGIHPEKVTELKEKLRGLTKENQTVQEALLEALPVMKAEDPGILAMALIKTLPKEQRGPIFKAGSVQNQLELLKTELPPSLDLNEFNYQSFGIGTHLLEEGRYPISSEQLGSTVRSLALKQLEDQIQQREKVARLAALILLGSTEDVENRNHGNLINRQEAQKSFTTLFSSSEDLGKAVMGTSFAQAALPDLLDDIGKKAIIPTVDAALAFLKPYLLEGEKTVLLPTTTLVEEPDQLKLGCGGIGTDCRAKELWAYMSSPADHSFFIYDKKREIKGYVALIEGTLVNEENPELPGEPILYLININGLTLSSTMTEQVLEMLDQATHQLGFRHLMIPTEGNVRAKANYAPIKKPLYDAIHGKKEISIRLKDATLRTRLFDQFAKKGKTDGTVGDNNVAVIYESKRSPDRPSIEITTATPEDIFTRPIIRKEALQFALEVYFSGKKDEGFRIAEAADIPKKEFNQIVYKFQNWEKASYNEYLLRISEALDAEGIELTPKFVNSHYYLFQVGFLNCPDALESMPAQTAAEFLRLVRMRSDHAPSWINTLIESFVDAHLKEFYALNPTAQEVTELRKRVNSIELNRNLIEWGLKNAAHTPRDFIILADLLTDEPYESYAKVFNQVVKENISRFFASEPLPTMAEVNELMSHLVSERVVYDVLERAVHRVKTPAEFLTLIQLDSGLTNEWAEEPSREHLARMAGIARFVKRHADEYFFGLKLVPSYDEIKALSEHIALSETATPQVSEKIRSKLIAAARTPDEFFGAMHPEDVEKRIQAIKKYQTHFDSLNPTKQDYSKLCGMLLEAH